MRLSKRTSLIIKICLDLAAFLFSLTIGFFVRFDLNEAFRELATLLPGFPIFIFIQFCCFYFFRKYSMMWRFSGTTAVIAIVKASASSTALIVIVNYFFLHLPLPRSIVLINMLLVIFTTSSVRLFVRHIYAKRAISNSSNDTIKRVLIYGAGQAGEQLYRNIEQTGSINVFVAGFVDDAPQKQKVYLHDKKVLGGREDLGKIVSEYEIDSIYLCIPSLTGDRTRELLQFIRTNVDPAVEIMTIPGLTDLVEGRITVNALRRLNVQDLLRRPPVELDRDPVKKLIRDQAVMIVGGGGSIGLELCQQVASYSPRQLILLDSSEYNVYRADQILTKQFPKVAIMSIVGNACDWEFLDLLFARIRPNIIFNAAAYKHVPLMEIMPNSAISNNLVSTRNLVSVADKYGVRKFIQISTDKAVNPTSVMGASKRVCELIISSFNAKSKVEYVMVRFGNVLGSSGSVIPLFSEQIERGGPITVTHPDITRYFMLISEAVELVLQAGALGNNKETYVLDMGQPVKILDLAEHMIKFAGKRPDEIKIVFTGLRPGEKLYEDLYFEGREVPTMIPGIFVLDANRSYPENFEQDLSKLIEECHRISNIECKRRLKQLVPEYNLDNSVTAS